MKTKQKQINRPLALLLSLCMVCIAFWGMGITVAANTDDAALSSLSYSVNGGESVVIPEFSPDNEFYVVTLPRSTPRDATITLSGIVTGENVRITGSKPAVLVYGVSSYEHPAEISVQAQTNTKTYSVQFYTESVVADFDKASIAGLDAKSYPQNNTPVFTVSGAGMENNDPAEGDIRFVPSAWQIDAGVLTGQWSEAPYSAAIALSELSLGRHTLTVTFTAQRFNEQYEDDMPTGVYNWFDLDGMEEEISLVKSVSFMVESGGSTQQTQPDTSAPNTTTAPPNSNNSPETGDTCLSAAVSVFALASGMAAWCLAHKQYTKNKNNGGDLK